MDFKIAQNIYELLYCEIKSYFMIKSFLNEYKNIKKYEDICKLVKKRKKLLLFPYKYTEKYKTKDIKLYKDNNYYYTLIDNKKMYLYSKIKYKAKRYIKNILLEQDKDSPHIYCDDSFKVEKNDIIFDIGAAEGYFTLKNIDKIKHAYLFECNPKWLKVLNKTFEPYKDKVTIINSKISDIDNNEFQTIDSICKKYNISKVDFIKMDIEGYEEKAIIGMKNTIKNNTKIAVCCYHTHNQEKRLRDLLKDKYNIKTNNSYMIYYYDYNISSSYLRHGILKCTKK